MSFSLYVHIPYCQSKCPYCDFNSYAAATWPEHDYVRALITELEHRAVASPWREQEIKTIFFGGGTPSLFSPQSINAVIGLADRLCGVERDAEITLEANPGTVDSAKLEGFRAAGVNRISFGAQSFDPATLKFLGRIHSADDTREAVSMARRAGFARLNLDLIFAVCGQTPETVRRDIEIAASLGPDHISAYNLTFEEGTTFFTELKNGRIRALPDEEQALMYALVREELPRRGYQMYEISNFAHPGHEARHNLSYWRAESYLGLGAGAHSFARIDNAAAEDTYGRRWWNERNPSRYIERALGAGNAEGGSETIDHRTAAGEFAFLNLRLREGFALAEFRSRFGREFDEVFGGAARLFEGGLLVGDNGRIRLSERGIELADLIFTEFV
jgi:putative oxygen-independent coproporphyrinogen III oxidase